MDRRSPRRLAPLALLALGTVLAVVWFLASGREDRRAPPTATNAPAESSGVAAVLEPVASPAERAAAERIAAPASAAHTDESAASPIQTPIEVLVVDALTQHPVADAEVRWGSLNETGLGVDRTRPRHVIEPEALLANAHRSTSDAEGRAVIDASVFPGRVLARKGTSSGTVWADANTARPIVIEMRADLGLVLRVVDGEGKPVAGVPVGLRDSPLEWYGCLWRGTTDERGLARVSRLQETERDFGRAFACIDTLLPSAQDVVVDLAAPSPEPVELVLPACGSLSVRIRDARGTLVVPQSMRLALASDFDRDEGSIAWGVAVFDPETLVDGVAVYPFVELGLEIVIEVMVSGRSPEVIAKGPQRLGERVELVLDIGDPLVVLAGRLVDERGEAIADRMVQAALTGTSDEGIGYSTEPLRTDRDGRFEQALSFDSPADLRGTLVLTPIGSGAAEGTSASLAVDGALLPGRNEVGNVVALDPRRLASGRVVDDLGAAISNASIHVLAGVGEAWGYDAGVQASCDASGNFAVQGATRAPQLQITAWHESHASGYPIDVSVGSTGVKIVLERGASIAGRVLVDEASLLRRLLVRVGRAEKELEPRTGAERTLLGSDGKFALTRLRSGIVHLEVRDRETKEILATIEDVRLSPGERTTDGRVETIDLRGKIAPSAPK